MSLLSLILYLPLQILFIPLAILGVALVGYRQLAVSRKLGVSQTAIEVLNGRWTMHIFGLRQDEACDRLAKRLPNTSTFGLWLTLAPLWLKYKISGELFLYPRVPEPGTEDLRDLMVVRTLHFDRIIERLIDDAEQFVIMGAGYDTRAYGPLSNAGVTIFELDQAEVQAHKRQALADARIAADHVRFVSVDFASENWADKLAASGFDSTKKTLFLWEGVTLYLSEAQVRKTLQEVRAHSTSGSTLLVDIYGNSFVEGLGKRAGVRETLELTGETLAFGLPMATDYESTLAEFIASESMILGETHFLGSTGSKGPFAVVAELQH